VRRARPSFAANDAPGRTTPQELKRELVTIVRLFRHNQTAMRRVEAVKARSDTKTWVMDRRARTRHLIELGGLVEKSGLYAALGDDDPDAALLGALLMLRDRIAGAGEAGAGDLGRASDVDPVALWRRRGRRALRGTDTGEPTS